MGEEPWAASGRSAKAGWSTLGLLDNILVLQDVVSTDKAFATAPIEGLKYRDTEMLLVGLQELKVRPACACAQWTRVRNRRIFGALLASLSTRVPFPDPSAILHDM